VNQSVVSQSSLPAPLGVLPDMPASWSDVDLSFDEAAERLIRAHAQDGRRRDLPIIDLRTWGVVPLNGKFALQPLAGHHPARELRSNGLTNLLGRLGAPVEFLRDRLPRTLQLATVNYLMASSERPLAATLRIRDEEVTAVVSDRYAPLDAEELVDTVRNAVREHGSLDEVRVRAVASGVVDVLRIVFPNRQQAVKPGDVTALGLDISSSAFGRSAVHVNALLWRLVCSNGLRVAERQGGFSFRHVGDSARLREGIREAIPTCLTHANGTMDRWRRAVDVMVERAAELVDGMRELTTPERARIGTELGRETGSSELPERIDLYSVVNAFTRAARDAEPARRLELESLAGQLLAERVTAT
jgi:uncharacterized protein DUF932